MIEDRIEVNIAGGLDVALPRMVSVRQKFDGAHLGDIPGTIAKEFQRPDVRARVKAGQVVAVGCGSRGVANIAIIAKCVIRELQALGAKPFIFPSMGSHGAATAEGQRKVLEGYGISEATMGVPVRATMDTTIVGELDDGTPVHMDKFAAEADGVVVINRIKPHTAFRGATESGVTKMLSIGIGKITGAATYHRHGMDTFPTLLPKVRDVNLARRNVMLGVGIVENAHDQTALIEVMPANQIAAREPALQEMAKRLMPRLCFDEIDVLVIDEMGKNISGAGFDPNITGRNRRAIKWEFGPKTKKIAVLGLTPETHGNATGLGGADVITMRLFKEIDVPSTYANIITSMNLDGGAIPIVMNNDREAIQLAVKTVVRVKPENCRIVRIRNTLELAQIQVSEPMLAEVRAHPEQFQIASPAAPFAFDAEGRVAPLPSAHEESTLKTAVR
ncbi:MAG TPA: lactate racemase domain-containing protein [Burkholderiales bacterium]|nr:lactate racemase domain-containing protein [Burkholderiales bacterium]